MSQLVETILIENGAIPLLQYHQARFDKSRLDLFSSTIAINLGNYVHLSLYRLAYKCRVLYDEKIRKVEYHTIQGSNIQSLRIIHADDVSYRYKFVARSALDKLWSQRNDADEILIVSNGFLTDAYYYNIVLDDGDQLYTPSHNLLPGVRRQKLLDEGRIISKPIRVNDIASFKSILLINALNPLGRIMISAKEIQK